MSYYLCEELIVEIFTRLPSKSLLRFRSLSKSLYSCIGSPDFIRIHTLRSPQKFLFRHRNGYKSEEDDFYTLHSEDKLPLCSIRYIGITPVRFPFSKSSKFIGICNGIFCWLHNDSFSLWNPSIKRKLRLPLCPNLPASIRINPWSGIGFGFDPISDDYKIVWLSSARKCSFVYAMKTGAWCSIASPTPLFHYSFFPAFFFNGALHWVVDGYHTESHSTNLPCIMTFELSTHVFGMIPLPEPYWSFLPTGLTTIQGYLALISFRTSVPYSWFQVRRDGSWSLPFELKTDKALIIRALQPTTRGDLLIDTKGEGFLVYNLEMRKLSRVMDFNAASRVHNIFQCVESLYMLDMGTACESNQLSYFGRKKTSKFRYLIDLSYYIQILFKSFFNMRRWFTR